MFDNHSHRDKSALGFTLIEVLLVVVVAGILATAALRTVAVVGNSTRTEETRQEMNWLASGIVGTAALHSDGVRSDFGYVGDVGSLPPSLDALRNNPGGLATWKGPYIANRADRNPTDFKTDAWGATYAYNGLDITSTGSGKPIVQKLASSTAELLDNQVTGNVYDVDGTPPGSDYADSIQVHLTVPDGSGGLKSRSLAVDAGGYFVFDSIPIGNHALDIVYLPSADTLHRSVSVLPNSSAYQEYFLGENLWGGGGTTGGGTGTRFVDGSDSLVTSDCSELRFSISNTLRNPVTVSWVKLSWPSPSAYFNQIEWNDATVYDNPVIGSGAKAVFTSSQTIAPGETVELSVVGFRESAGGGGDQVDMTDVTFTVDLSDGSSITFRVGDCSS